MLCSCRKNSKRNLRRRCKCLGESTSSGPLRLDDRPFAGTLRIKLPLFENPNGQVRRNPQRQYKFDRTVLEIKREFDGYDFYPTPFEGNWRDDESGEWDDDLNVLFEIDGEFDWDRIRWLKGFRRRLKRRFKQKAIYMTIAPFMDI